MLDTLISFTTFIFVFLFPLFSLPITADSYEYNKMFLLFSFDLTFLFLLTLKWIQTGKITVRRSLFDIPLFLIAGITLISTLFQSPNVTVALTTPLGTSTIIAGFFLYFLLTQTVQDSHKKTFLFILTIDSILISFYTLLLYLGILPQSLFTPAGSLPPTAIFLGVISVYLFSHIIPFFYKNNEARPKIPIVPDPKLNRKTYDDVKTGYFAGKNTTAEGLGVSEQFGIEGVRKEKFVSEGLQEKTFWNQWNIFYIVSFLLIAGTTLLIIFHLFTDQRPSILPIQFGWAILLEVLKNIRTLSLGIGPTNFMTAFTLGKPALINTSSVWNIIFTTSSSFLFTLVSETGLFTGILYIVILIKSIKRIIKSTSHFPLIISLITLLLTLILLPTNMTVFILLMILLALASNQPFDSAQGKQLTMHLTQWTVVNYLLFIPIGLGIGLAAYLSGRAYSAEVVFKQSLDALVNNQGSTAYALQKSAIVLNPYLDRYHLAFSKTNLALAHALSGKQNLSGEEKQTLPRLAQLAIVEARNAVLLYRTNVVNWDNLGRTYAGLTNFAAGSENWAIQSFEQRLILDPLNPQARLALGAFYLSLRQQDNAQNLIRQAIALKQDYANAHYYLAALLNSEKKYKDAYKELQITVAILPPDSEDSKKVVSEMNEIAKLLPESDIREEIPQVKSEEPQQLEPVSSSSGAIQSNPPSVPTISVPEPPR